jgi:hypothetical protein
MLVLVVNMMQVKRLDETAHGFVDSGRKFHTGAARRS